MSPRSIGRLRERLRADIEQRWEKVAPEGRCEFVHAFAQPIPSVLIAELLGVPGMDEPSALRQFIFSFLLLRRPAVVRLL